MKIYWSLASIPELSTFSAAQKRRILRKCLWKAMGHLRFWMLGFVPYFCFFVISILGMLYLTLQDLSVPGFTFVCFGYATITMIVGLIGNQQVVHLLIPFIRDELPEYCSSCGYNLTGNTSGICPECGVEKPKPA